MDSAVIFYCIKVTMEVNCISIAVHGFIFELEKGTHGFWEINGNLVGIARISINDFVCVKAKLAKRSDGKGKLPGIRS